MKKLHILLISLVIALAAIFYYANYYDAPLFDSPPVMLIRCGQERCTMQSAEAHIDGLVDPFDKDPLWWKTIYDDLQSQRDSAFLGVLTFLGRIGCRSGCERTETVKEFYTLFPMGPSQEDIHGCSEEKYEYIMEISGTSDIGNCELAAADLATKLSEKYQELQDKTEEICGENCDYSVNFEMLNEGMVYCRFESGGLFGIQAIASITIPISIQCLPKLLHEEDYTWIFRYTITGCINCGGTSGMPTHTHQPAGGDLIDSDEPIIKGAGDDVPVREYRI